MRSAESSKRSFTIENNSNFIDFQRRLGDAFLRPASPTSTTTSGQVSSSTQQPVATSSSTSATSSSPAPASTSTSSSSGSIVKSTTATSTSAKVTTVSSSSATSVFSQGGTVEIVLPEDVGNNESINFTPSKVTVVIGINNTIVWNDLDFVQHTVRSAVVPSGAKTSRSGILNEGQTFTVVLTVPGLYSYDCSIHPDWMVGTIQVVPG